MTGAGRVAEDYLKTIWSATEWGAPPATVSSLADRFHTTRATVSVNLKRLSAQGLLTHEPYAPIELTGRGARLAVSMVRTHRILETFLVELLGYAWDEVHDLAEGLEHAATPDLVDRLDALLGHPRSDPHGDPIPSRTGEVRYHEGARTLAVAGPGAWQVIRIPDAAAERLRDLIDRSIVPGAVLTVGDGGVRLSGAPEPVPLDEESWASIIVRPVDDGDDAGAPGGA